MSKCHIILNRDSNYDTSDISDGIRGHGIKKGIFSLQWDNNRTINHPLTHDQPHE